MEKINLNHLAKDVTDIEGGEEEVNIAQTKDVIEALFEKLCEYSDEQILEAVRRKQKK